MDRPTRITKEDLRHRLDAGEPVIVLDTRSPAAWDEAQETLPGAIRVPPDDVEQRLGDVEPGHLVVTYCT